MEEGALRREEMKQMDRESIVKKETNDITGAHLKMRRWAKNKRKTKGTGEQHSGGRGASGGSKIDFHSSFSSPPLFSLERLPKVFGLMAPFLLLIHQIQEGIPKHNASLGSCLN